MAAWDCSSARAEYNTAYEQVAYTLKRYIRCVEASDGADDCYTEFRRLKSAQDDFSSSVSAIGIYCRY